MHCLLCHSICYSIFFCLIVITTVLTILVHHINATVRRLFQCRFEEETILMSSTVSVLFVISF